MEIKNQRGQTMVEYILLLAVVVSLVLTFYNSEAYRRLFGSQGKFGTKIKQDSEFAYRHAYLSKNQDGSIDPDVSIGEKDITAHPSYYDIKNSGTRFFGPKDPYGQ
ncbi:hypothetical protein [Peredibacter starrii]|uniref:Uncharacterized protein n=1 Tax=Peredibacter starrii TaxID=28202 RepID=A0AAX4HRQ9_9BACT|nr:hypothetical protein [Peredibacter starrii]WPU65589.1 hypothetical protein SOO65_02395 [Peredibacter starrii]